MANRPRTTATKMAPTMVAASPSNCHWIGLTLLPVRGCADALDHVGRIAHASFQPAPCPFSDRDALNVVP
jgi:hypothetical protein